MSLTLATNGVVEGYRESVAAGAGWAPDELGARLASVGEAAGEGEESLVGRSLLAYNIAVAAVYAHDYERAAEELGRVFSPVSAFPFEDLPADLAAALLPHMAIVFARVGSADEARDAVIAMDAQAGGGGARFTAVAAKVRVCAELGDHERAAVVAASEADRDHDAVCSAYGAAVHRHSAEALDLLRESTRKSGSLVVANNTGVVQASEGKWALAVVSFGAAIVANRHTQSALVPRPAHLYSADRRAELCYNYGVALLRSGRPARAHAVLATEACIVRGRAPIYWLRLAEACCAAVAVAAGSTKRNLQEVGRGRFRRLVVPGAGTGGGGASMGEEGGSDQGLTLGAARVYLDHGVGLVEAGGDQAPLGVAIYALRAFVALGLDDPEVALWAGREALARVREAQHLAFSLPPRLVYAAHLYVVEAMCRLGRAVEADKVIGPAESLVGFIEGLTAEDDGGGLGSARGVFYVNLACCRLLQGRLDDAQAAAARANDADPGSRAVVLLLAYLALLGGKTEKARALIHR